MNDKLHTIIECEDCNGLGYGVIIDKDTGYTRDVRCKTCNGKGTRDCLG